jgi:hypothetical protein
MATEIVYQYQEKSKRGKWKQFNKLEAPNPYQLLETYNIRKEYAKAEGRIVQITIEPVHVPGMQGLDDVHTWAYANFRVTMQTLQDAANKESPLGAIKLLRERCNTSLSDSRDIAERLNLAVHCWPHWNPSAPPGQQGLRSTIFKAAT